MNFRSTRSMTRLMSCAAAPRGACCLEHDPEKWLPVFPRDKREAFARRSCSDNNLGPELQPVTVSNTAHASGHWRAKRSRMAEQSSVVLHGVEPTGWLSNALVSST